DLLRILDDLDLALEHALRGAIENALVDLPAVILRDEVTGDRRRVGMLLTANEIGAVQDAVGIAALKPRLQLIARELRAGGQRKILINCAGGEIDIGIGEVESGVALALVFVMVEPRALAKLHIGDGVGEIGMAVNADMLLKQRDPAACAKADDVPHMAGIVARSRQARA